MTENPPVPVRGGARTAHQERVRCTPLLTVLIVVFRDRDELRKIIESVLSLKSEDLEIVVVDGFSRDGTVELLEQLGEKVDFWLSEPDRGIYDAMNKGLRVAAGTYILHLNAGDRLLNIPWQELRQCAVDKVDVVCCRVLLDSRIEFVSRTSLLSKLDNTWHHQGTFYRRAAHLGYDASYRIAADFDHNQKLLKMGCSIRELQTVVADHEGNGISTIETGHQEIYRSVLTNFGWPYVLLSWIRFILMDLRRWMRATFGAMR
jgi:glycosyltransferase involved in cell wall biosynthesis